MKDGQKRAASRDRDAHRGIVRAISAAFGLPPLLTDQMADAAFASSIERLRGVNGLANGGDEQ